MRKVFFVLLAILCALAVFLYLEKKDYTGYVLKLNDAVNGALVRNGVGDEHIVEHYYKEGKKGLKKYLEITRKINLRNRPRKDLDLIKQHITDAVRELKPEVRYFKKGDYSFHLQLGRDKINFINLVFLLKEKTKVAVVIDDLGYQTAALDDFLSLPVPVTFAILPKERYSREIAKRLQDAGRPYLMHLPMEPEHMEKNNPGKAALLVNMTDAEIERTFLENLKWVGNPAGVNNHMGSEFTKHRDKMKVVLEIVRRKGMFFFDSSTTPGSVAGAVAGEIGLPFGINNVFLDMVDDPEHIEKQFALLARVAKKNGRAAGIGHIHKKHLIEVLRRIIPVFEEEGIEFVDLTGYIEGKPAK